MTLEQFAKWSAFFTEQLAKPGEDTTYLDDWYRELKDYDLEDGMEAIRWMRARLLPTDAAKKLERKILEYLRSKEALIARQIRMRKLQEPPPGNLSGEDWLNSDRRKQLLERMTKSNRPWRETQ